MRHYLYSAFILLIVSCASKPHKETDKVYIKKLKVLKEPTSTDPTILILKNKDIFWVYGYFI